VDVIRGVGFVVRLDERTPRESLWLVTGRPAAARAEDLDTFFASPLKGALGLADAVLVRPDWSILVDGSARRPSPSPPGLGALGRCGPRWWSITTGRR
jgi:hypothetical protein